MVIRQPLGDRSWTASWWIGPVLTAVAVIAGPAATLAANPPFQLETIVSAAPGNMGYGVDMQIDSDNRPHVSYYEYSQGVRFAAFDHYRWTTEVVDATTGFGSTTSLAFNSVHHPCISYTAGATEEIRYATKWGGSWHIETVATATFNMWGSDLALDSGDNPHIVYTSAEPGGVWYAYKSGGNWITEPIYLPESAFGISLVIDDADVPHVSFGTHDSRDLYYAHRTGGTWTVTPVTGSGNVGASNSLAIDSRGEPRIVFDDDTAGTLRYAAHGGGLWSTGTIIDQFGGNYSSCTLELTASDEVHVAYSASNSYSVRYAVRVAGVFVKETIDAGGVGTFVSMALRSDGIPHVAYYDSNRSALAHAMENGPRWRHWWIDGQEAAGLNPDVIVASDGTVTAVHQSAIDGHLQMTRTVPTGWETTLFPPMTIAGPAWPSLAFDGNGDLRVAYSHNTGSSAGGIELATYSVMTWVVESILPGIGATSYCDLVYAPDGSAHLAYYQAVDADLYYATNSSGAWVTESVAVAGDVGKHVSLTLDSLGRPQLCYFDDTYNDLVYSKKVGGFWTFEVIDNNVLSLDMIELSVDANDVPRVVYQDSRTYYADRTGSVWTISPASHYPEQAGAAVIDDRNIAHVVRQNRNTTQIEFLARGPLFWVRDEIQSASTILTGDMALALDGSYDPHFVYYDPIAQQLVYATRSNGIDLEPQGSAPVTYGDRFIVGENISMYPWQLRNWGGRDSGQYVIRTYLSDDNIIDANDLLLGSLFQTMLSAYNERTISPAALAAPDVADGNYDLGVLVDYPDLNAEFDETNNTSSWRIGVFQPIWTDLTALPLSDYGNIEGVAIGDFDNDGDEDIYRGEIGHPNLLMRNDGTGGFTDVTVAPLDDAGSARAVAWADMDNDGDLDLFLANSSTSGSPSNLLARNDGFGVFADVSSPTTSGGLGTVGATWVDYDLDGFVDLYLVHANATNQLLHNEGNGTFVDATTPPLDNDGGEAASWADYDNDGDSDLYLTSVGPNRLLRNDGGGSFTDVSTAPVNSAASSFASAWGDYDNDGDLDLYVVNYNQPNALYRNDGSGVFVAITPPLIADSGTGVGAAWGDYDNDGWLDLYLSKDIEESRLFRNDGLGGFGEVAPRAIYANERGNDVAWGDMNADGRLDLVLANATGTQLFSNNVTNANHWLQIHLEGVVSNGSAIGARIKVVHDGITQIREIGGGGGRHSQSSMVASFGLGASSTVQSVRITWPSKIVTSYGGLAVDRRWDLTEIVPEWIEVAQGPAAGTGFHRGLAWGDYDDDGAPDVYLSNQQNFANRLLHNTGSETFVDIATGTVASTDDSQGAVWGDFDNNGTLDLYLCEGNAANRMLQGDGTGAFIDASVTPLNDSGPSVAAAAVDYDQDGYLDLYIVNDGAANRLIRNNGDATYSDATTGSLGDTNRGQSASWGDYDNDGWPDLYLVNMDSANRLWHNDAGTGFTEISGPAINDLGDGMAAAWGDYDNDGWLDIIVVNDLAANVLLHNLAGAGFADATTAPLVGRAGGRGVAWGDYDNDGDLDLYLAHNGPANQLLRNDGSGVFVDTNSVVVSSNGAHQAATWVDYDQDGDLDLYVANAASPNRLYRNMIAGLGHWLHVDLSATVSNRAAIGARVRLVAGGISQIREVRAGTGYRSQESLRLEFGLGAATMADSVIVEWPSGIQQTRLAVSADQVLSLREAQWSDVTVGVLAGTLTSTGVTWADFDNDKRPDLFVTNSIGQNRLLWNGVGGWTDPAPAGLVALSASQRAACADYDNDGDTDLLVTNDMANIVNVDTRLYRNDGAMSFTNVTPPAMNFLFGSSAADASWIDYDNDGRLDAYLVHTFFDNRLMRNLGGDSFSDMSTPPLNIDRHAGDAAWGDFDNDGDLDLYLTQFNNVPNPLLRNDGGGVFVEMSPGVVNDLDVTTGAAWGDYDNDGDLDLYVTKWTLDNRLYRNDGNGVFANVTNGELAAPGQCNVAAWGDYDNDGWLDLYVGMDSGPDQLLRNLGGGAFTNAADGPMGTHDRTKACAWADFDGDGDLDLYVAGIGANQLLRNELVSDNHWLHVDLVGTVSNRSAIGSRVWLYARGGGRQMRELSDDASKTSQGSLTVEFGAGSATFADSVVVDWPSGLRQMVRGVVLDQRITVTEGGTATAAEEAPVYAFALHQAVPNPFNARTTIHYDLPIGSRVDLRIVDLAGRRVRVLENGVRREAGSHQVVWDGHDHMGRSVASGVYFYRLVADGFEAAGRVVLVK